MPPLPDRLGPAAERWVTRLLAGSWTHAGYLNWDTGRGYRRWHSGQYWAFALQGLQTIAVAAVLAGPAQGAGRSRCSTAASCSTAGWADDGGGARAAADVRGRHADEVTSAASARACWRPPHAPSARDGLAAGDRAAAAVGVRLRHRPAGGDHAVLLDGDRARRPRGARLRRHRARRGCSGPAQRVASGTGGGPPGAFGIVVDGPAGRRLLATSARARPAAAILRSPPAASAPARVSARPYAGPFELSRRAAGWRAASCGSSPTRVPAERSPPLARALPPPVPRVPRARVLPDLGRGRAVLRDGRVCARRRASRAGRSASPPSTRSSSTATGSRGSTGRRTRCCPPSRSSPSRPIRPPRPSLRSSHRRPPLPPRVAERRRSSRWADWTNSGVRWRGAAVPSRP